MVTGYKLQAAYFAASNPRSPFADPFGTGMAPPNLPIDRNPTGGLTPPSGKGDLTVNVQLADGTVIGKAVLKDFKRTAQRQFGDSTKWSAIQ
jgi:hypothetical protein